MAPKNSRGSRNCVQIYPDAEALEKLKGRLPTFQPHDVTSILRLPTSEAHQEAGKLTSSVINGQLDELFNALGIDPSAPDAWRKGFQTLAALHHGIGHFSFVKPVPPNRNAKKWTAKDDEILYELVKEDEQEGVDQALRKISKDPKKWGRLPLSSTSRSQTPGHELRYQALRKRWTRVSKMAPPNSLLAALVGDYPVYGSEKDQASWRPNLLEFPPLPGLGKSNTASEQ